MFYNINNLHTAIKISEVVIIRKLSDMMGSNILCSVFSATNNRLKKVS